MQAEDIPRGMHLMRAKLDYRQNFQYNSYLD